MENEFDEVMRKRTDADLIKILDSAPDDYQPAALEAAKREFDRRNLSGEQIAAVNQEIAQKEAVVEAIANEPLSTYMKILIFIFPIKGPMTALLYKSDGNERKAKEIKKWSLYGFGFYAALFLIIYLYYKLTE